MVMPPPAQPPLQPPGRPPSITAAGILWISYGSLALFGDLYILKFGVNPITLVGLFVGIAFLTGGIQALTGRARTLLATGIVSIVWGALQLLAFLVVAATSHGRWAPPAALLALVGLVIGGTVITAGILACVGNARFKAWRSFRGM
jgi:hypothetical protein